MKHPEVLLEALNSVPMNFSSFVSWLASVTSQEPLFPKSLVDCLKGKRTPGKEVVDVMKRAWEDIESCVKIDKEDFDTHISNLYKSSILDFVGSTVLDLLSAYCSTPKSVRMDRKKMFTVAQNVLNIVDSFWGYDVDTASTF